MKEVPVEKAIGMQLGHDLTQIIPGKFEGVAFRKGHLIREEDIPVLHSMGKFHVYVMEISNAELHEEEAALEIANSVRGDGVELTPPSQGRVNLIAQYDGLVMVDQQLLYEINSVPEVILASVQNGIPVKKGEIVAGTRIIPVKIDRKSIETVKQIASSKPKISITPFTSLKVGMIVTGTEVYKGLIKDGFEKKVKKKLGAYNSQITKRIVVPDEKARIVSAIQLMLNEKIDLLILTGGMSVDPDDRTPGAIREAGIDIVSYGVPVLPGSMFLMGYYGELPVMGLPGCVMWDPVTVFDIVLPWIVARKRITKSDLIKLGYGGLLSRKPHTEGHH
ncbi:molybdopterin biosynthesis protein [Collibacillus ludicampi]|uniref:Molybdopterin molybdenumtransferase n=1 Tax=Collibacillus ludicampi TaxID=2771369 RepID=A0AAV4LAZ0_9BACL|nr:molybdopterin-binding protein [Collibacillus ludicampi]GIM44963.1 molybdopterin biosynthesis protein [Collibacillus ludicampi]